ncbi:X-Pro dipeptidyl-peptidase [Hydrocarboniclastica marina]|uniref:X-Pro dipeptidyl-peptidase n=2 Tax=Hydrocarboniclastica marina TaxID=2259620 RepID=A0A4P7XEP2_9ALTE|nr:X-Pro dipeptidyl-peptidase [Hydrocarboniclastica marina]
MLMRPVPVSRTGQSGDVMSAVAGGVVGTFKIWLLLCSALLSACAGVDVKERYQQTGPDVALSQTSYHVDIKSHDGVVLRATVYQPALEPGVDAPVIIHTHGFGAFRAPRRWSIYGQLVLSGQAAMAAWDSGYWVISYDQRGFGDSEGDVHLMDPDYEVKDFSSVVDWADENLPRILRDPSGDPFIGGSGESYGGAVQILASMQDPRIDAIVPIATWYDLKEALAPNGVVQSFWPFALDWLGTIGSGFDFDLINETSYQSALAGDIDSATTLDMSRRSPAEYCEKGEGIQADALFIQGLRDVLFPLNHGLANWECAREAGQDVYLVALQDGHIMPWPMQAFSGLPLFNTQANIRCGPYRTTAVAMILAFWDDKLKGKTTMRPRHCLTFAFGEPMPSAELLLEPGGEVFEVPEARVKLAFSGSLELLLQPWDWFAGWFIPAGTVLPATEQPVTGGTLRPAFLPLYRAREGDFLAGVPRLQLVTATERAEQAGMLFAGIGVRRPGSSAVEVIHEQFTPVPVPSGEQADMAGVVYPLAADETVGLVLQGYTGAYYGRGEGWRDTARVSGAVTLPLHHGGMD